MNNPNFTLEKLAIKHKSATKKPETFTAIARKMITQGGWRYEMYKVIYRSKVFSITLLILILSSSSAVILQSVSSLYISYKDIFIFLEWFFTILFTVEYFSRIIVAPQPIRYMLSTMGIIDFISIFPMYFGIIRLSNTSHLIVIRLVRLFRLLRVFDLIEYTKYAKEVRVLLRAVHASQRKISIFILSVLIAVTILGSFMYVIEKGNHGFESIPKSIYWAVVTITAVGYGDIVPKTPMGQALASLLMLLSFGIIVVFTSIVGAEIYRQRDEKKMVSESKSCLDCGMPGHDSNASYCKYCGGRLWG